MKKVLQDANAVSEDAIGKCVQKNKKRKRKRNKHKIFRQN